MFKRSLFLTLLLCGVALALNDPMPPYMAPWPGGGGVSHDTTIIDTANASGLISDSLDAAVRSGTQNINVFDATISNNFDVIGEFKAGALGPAGYVIELEVSDPYTLTINEAVTLTANGGANIGNDGTDHYAMAVSTSSVQIGGTGLPITLDAFGDVNAHTVLSVGDVGDGTNPIIIDPQGGADFPGIVGGGDVVYDDSLNYGVLGVNDGGGPGNGHIRLSSALHHVDGYVEAIDIQPVEDDAELGAVTLAGAKTDFAAPILRLLATTPATGAVTATLGAANFPTGSATTPSKWFLFYDGDDVPYLIPAFLYTAP